MKKKFKKRFIRPVRAMAELYDKEYNDVLRIYCNQNGSIANTRMILNLEKLNSKK